MRHTTREAMDIAVVGVGAIVQLGEDNDVCKDSKICLGAVAPVPMRAHNAEGILKGKEITDELVEEAAQAASDESKPITDVRGTAQFRRELVRALASRMVTKAIDDAKSR